MSRSFTIEKMTRAGDPVRFKGGRYISETPSGAAKKAFTQAYRHMRNKPTSLVIHMRETTQGSAHKTFQYRVRRKAEHTEVERNGETISYTYSLHVKAL